MLKERLQKDKGEGKGQDTSARARKDKRKEHKRNESVIAPPRLDIGFLSPSL